MRFERKYLLDRDTAFLLKQRMSYVLTPDVNNECGAYKVSSLYFDDRYDTAFFDKQNGVLQREKLRVRYYNDSMNVIHLECKHKHGQMVWKEHEPLSAEQFEMMRRGDYGFIKLGMTESEETADPSDKKPLLERFYTTHLVRRLRPVVAVDYVRQAYTHKAGDVRITFDSALAARKPSAQKSFSIMPEKNVIMEIKYTHFLPLFINELLSGFQLTQQLAISKFVMGRLAMRV